MWEGAPGDTSSDMYQEALRLYKHNQSGLCHKASGRGILQSIDNESGARGLIALGRGEVLWCSNNQIGQTSCGMGRAQAFSDLTATEFNRIITHCMRRNASSYYDILDS